MKNKLRPICLLFIPLLAACQHDDDDGEEFMICPQGFTCTPSTSMTSLTAPDPTSGAEEESGGESGDESGGESNGEAAGDPSGGESNGDECTPADNQCLGDDNLDACGEDGKLHAVTCAYVCGADRQSLGCQTNGEGLDVCYCGDPIESCDYEGKQECGAANALRVCEQGVWTYYDCDTACVEGGYSGAESDAACQSEHDIGLNYCVCLDSGCPYGSQRCADGEHLAFCDGDGWLSDSCEELCQDSGFSGSLGCHYITNVGGDSCGCY